MWIPKLLDTLIAQGKISPMVAVMTDESVPSIRTRELECDVQFEDFLAKELVPWTRENYDVAASPEDPTLSPNMAVCNAQEALGVSR
jgi:enterochelin esterase-like enzyme